MASRRSKGHGVTPGTIRGEDRHWLSDSHWERRYNHAMDFCKASLDQTAVCPLCKNEAAKCINAAVTKNLGAKSWWQCECGKQFVRLITQGRMLEYYREDAKKTRVATAAEASTCV